MRHLARLLWVTLVTVLVASCDGRPRRATPHLPEASSDRSEPHIGQIDLRSGAPERPGSSLLGRQDARGFADLMATLRQMRDEKHLAAVFVRLGTARIALARAEEIGLALAALHTAGREVTCHADGYSNGTMLLAATGCDRIWLSPAGTVDTVGLAAQLLFGRSLLDKLHVRVDFLQAGKYKGASEPFERDSASPEALASLRSALGGLRQAWREGISKGRARPIDTLQLEDGPHTPRAATDLGLIDDVGFADEALEQTTRRAGVSARVAYFGGSHDAARPLTELLRLITGTSSMAVPHITVVTATGGITMRGGGALLPSRGGIEEHSLTRLLRRLKQDEDVRAVVLRIDSPGGSALASDLLWHQLMALRDAKPLIMSLGGMAASGGYYLASAGSKIVADRTTIVGSIGVVAGKISFAESLAQLGVHAETVAAPGQSAARALYGSPFAAWDEATRTKVRDAVMETYALFVERVAKGRNLPRERVAAVAEGRIMGGDAAVHGGLVDEIGGLGRAIALARELAGGTEQLPIRIERPPSELMTLLGADSPADSAAAGELDASLRRRAMHAAGLALGPLEQHTEALAASIAPLLGGEHLIAALPYALVLQ